MLYKGEKRKKTITLVKEEQSDILGELVFIKHKEAGTIFELEQPISVEPGCRIVLRIVRGKSRYLYVIDNLDQLKNDFDLATEEEVLSQFDVVNNNFIPKGEK